VCLAVRPIPPPDAPFVDRARAVSQLITQLADEVRDREDLGPYQRDAALSLWPAAERFVNECRRRWVEKGRTE
jgi:hypothetical protein